MPGARDDGVKIAIVRAPSKLVMGAPGIGHQPRRIAGAPRPYPESNLSTGHPGDRSDDFPNRMAPTVAEVIGACPRIESVERANMRLRKIFHMHVIPDAAAVRRRVVVAEYGQGGSSWHRGFERKRNEMGFRLVVFADFAGR